MFWAISGCQAPTAGYLQTRADRVDHSTGVGNDRWCLVLWVRTKARYQYCEPCWQSGVAVQHTTTACPPQYVPQFSNRTPAGAVRVQIGIHMSTYNAVMESRRERILKLEDTVLEREAEIEKLRQQLAVKNDRLGKLEQVVRTAVCRCDLVRLGEVHMYGLVRVCMCTRTCVSMRAYVRVCVCLYVCACVCMHA